MANNVNNLVSLADRTTEEKRAIAIKGGKASGEARRKNATMLSVLENMLNKVPETEDNIEELNNQELATLGLIKGAIDGQAKNYEIIQQMMEKKEKEMEKEKKIIYIPAKDMGRAFVDLYRDIKDRKHDDYWLEGGRGSLKSSLWSEIVPEELENHPNWCAICIRKVANTLKDSVYSQLEWGMDKLNETYPYINEKWVKTKSPLEMKNKETGQIIYFRGADDPGKIKSIKPPKDMYIALIIYEEFDQMNGMEEVRKIDQSVKRGGNEYLTFRIYNTPKSRRHFVNIEKRQPNPKRLVHKSTYLDAPIEWLGQPFIDDAELLKQNNLKAYQNEYLGDETGDGGNVFENVEIREITDEEINTFDYIYQGIDWGYFPDPFAWIKCCYDSSNQTIYIYDEYKANKMGNEEVWNNLVKEKNVDGDSLIIADSAEPKSIGDFKMYGACIKGAEKGPGSVDYSMKWLSSRVKIVIDPNRCPESAYEFSTYEYDQDKDGNYISGYVDANNHFIDATRYALNMIWKKKGQ